MSCPGAGTDAHHPPHWQEHVCPAAGVIHPDPGCGQKKLTMPVLKALPVDGRECTDSGAGKETASFLETDHSHDSLSVSDSLTHRLSLPWFLKDISGLHYDRKNRRLYVLSHESALVMVSDPRGRLEGVPLRQGHSGLERDIPQAEGIASDGRNSLWIVSQTGFTASAGQRRHDGWTDCKRVVCESGETKGILRPVAPTRNLHFLSFCQPVCGKTFTFSNYPQAGIRSQ